MPIPVRPKPFLPPGCPGGMYAGLARLSAGCPPDRGRLHTCYSPVRRSPAEKASFLPAAPRLACVKPAASVHPEPGSNSPLFVYSFLFYSLGGLLSDCLFVLTGFLLYRFTCDLIDGRLHCLLVSVCMARNVSTSRSLSCGIVVNVLLSLPGSRRGSVPDCGCKITTLSGVLQISLCCRAYYSEIFHLIE